MKNKYNIYDKLYQVREKYYQTIHPCTNCDGDGKLLTTSGKILACLQCEGSGKYFASQKKFQVANLMIEVNSIKVEDSEIWYSDYECPDFDDWISEENLFLTKEEAQAECDRRN